MINKTQSFYLQCVLIIGLIFLAVPSFAQKEKPSLNRTKIVEQYLTEFGDGSLKNYPKIQEAIIGALNQLPLPVFLSVTDRKHPIIFIVNITSGIAKYANSTEFNQEKGKPPAFKKGFYMIKLGDELEGVGTVTAIKGIVAHEIAHRYLNHLQMEFNCNMERDANREIRSWGFEKEYLAAKELFGAKHKGDSPCHDEELEKATKTSDQ